MDGWIQGRTDLVEHTEVAQVGVRQGIFFAFIKETANHKVLGPDTPSAVAVVLLQAYLFAVNVTANFGPVTSDHDVVQFVLVEYVALGRRLCG